MTTENISYILDYTTEGTNTINYEDAEYRAPAVIVTAIPEKLASLHSQAHRLMSSLDTSAEKWEQYAQQNPEEAAQEEDAANEATEPERDKLAEILDEIDDLEKLQKKWEISLVEEEAALRQFIDGDESGLTAQIDAETAANWKYAPNWIIDRDAEKRNLYREIGHVLRSLYELHRIEFFYSFLPSREDGISGEEDYKNASPELKKTLFTEYWNQA